MPAGKEPVRWLCCFEVAACRDKRLVHYPHFLQTGFSSAMNMTLNSCRFGTALGVDIRWPAATELAQVIQLPGLHPRSARHLMGGCVCCVCCVVEA